jgi:hypothetical protein
MKAVLDLGAEIDILTPEEYRRDQNEREHRRRAQHRDRRPDTFMGNGIFPASGNLLIVPEPWGPPPGYIWHVMAVTLAGLLGTSTTTLGQGDVYIGPRPSNVTTADVGAFWKSTTRYVGMPLEAAWLPYQRVVRHGEAIYAIVSAGTGSAPSTSDPYTFAGDVMLERDPDTRAEAP